MIRIIGWIVLCAILHSCSKQQVTVPVTANYPSVVPLTDSLFQGMKQVVVSQEEDVVFKRPMQYQAYAFNEVLIRAFPNWKELLQEDAVLIMRAPGDYAPQMPFSDAFSGRVYLASQKVGGTEEQPYDCWEEGGEEHCDLGYFVIWTDGYYPDRPQPWGTYELEVVDFTSAYAAAIPNTNEQLVQEGFTTYRQYCLECHRVNFAGGIKATEHVVRKVPLERPLLEHFLFRFRKYDATTYMPDYNGILDSVDVDRIFAYVDFMSREQNACENAPQDERCVEVLGE